MPIVLVGLQQEKQGSIASSDEESLLAYPSAMQIVRKNSFVCCEAVLFFAWAGNRLC